MTTTDIDDLIAAMAPPTRSYTFADLPGRPVLTLRPLTGDNPAAILRRLDREKDGAKADPTTIEEVNAARAADAADFAAMCVEALTIDGQDRTADAVKFCIALAVRAYTSRWAPLVVFCQAVDKPEASLDAIAGE
jgi:hypothetical protein